MAWTLRDAADSTPSTSSRWLRMGRPITKRVTCPQHETQAGPSRPTRSSHRPAPVAPSVTMRDLPHDHDGPPHPRWPLLTRTQHTTSTARGVRRATPLFSGNRLGSHRHAETPANQRYSTSLLMLVFLMDPWASWRVMDVANPPRPFRRASATDLAPIWKSKVPGSGARGRLVQLFAFGCATCRSTCTSRASVRGRASCARRRPSTSCATRDARPHAGRRAGGARQPHVPRVAARVRAAADVPQRASIDVSPPARKPQMSCVDVGERR
jgi:hypothetical protein